MECANKTRVNYGGKISNIMDEYVWIGGEPVFKKEKLEGRRYADFYWALKKESSSQKWGSFSRLGSTTNIARLDENNLRVSGLSTKGFHEFYSGMVDGGNVTIARLGAMEYRLNEISTEEKGQVVLDVTKRINDVKKLEKYTI